MATLLQRARQNGTPLIDGETVTFVWHGRRAAQLVGDFTGPHWDDPLDLAQVAPGVWSRTLTFPTDAYLEYAYWLDDQRLPDPLNPHTTPDGFGRRNNCFYMPAAGPSPLIRGRGTPRGSLIRLVVEEGFLLAGRRRPVVLYRPPGREPCPLLVVLDGQDYHPRGRLVPIVENLITTGRIRPLALAMVHHGGPARGVEYACNDATLLFLLDHILPLARQHLDLLDPATQPGACGILGASMGGLMALYAGLRAPAIFGSVLSQSGAFTLDEVDTVVWDLVRHGPLLPLHIWMDVGRYEWLLDCNRRLHKLLAEKGYAVAYREHNGGHNYPSWRNNLGHGLERLFPPS